MPVGYLLFPFLLPILPGLLAHVCRRHPGILLRPRQLGSGFQPLRLSPGLLLIADDASDQPGNPIRFPALSPRHGTTPRSSISDPPNTLRDYGANSKPQSSKPPTEARAPELNTFVPAVLLIRRTDNGNWALPGGAIELHESLTNVAVREAYKETASGARSPKRAHAGTNSPRSPEPQAPKFASALSRRASLQKRSAED
jgi:hypothetical protein